jgi:hypothetical protein
MVKLTDIGNKATVAKLLKDEVLFNPREGYVATHYTIERKPQLLFNPEKLDWGNAVEPKSAASKAKGNYWICRDKKADAYKEIEQKLMDEAIKIGNHSIVLDGWNYWFNFSGGIARRAVKQ